MNLLQEYKELYYKEIEFNDYLNNKITTCITFLTILGSAQILLWTQFKDFPLTWYTGVYLVFCCASTILFLICILLFFRAYSGYKVRRFSIKLNAQQNTNVLNSVPPEQRDIALKELERTMSERFVNDAIYNRELNITKNNRHRFLIQIIMIAFVVTFVTFSINIGIGYYESKHANNETQNIHIEGGEIHVR